MPRPQAQHLQLRVFPFLAHDVSHVRYLQSEERWLAIQDDRHGVQELAQHQPGGDVSFLISPL